MRTWNVPHVGYVKFEARDYVFFILGVALAVYAIYDLFALVETAFDFTLVVARFLLAIALIAITLHNGRRRIMWEERPNPIALAEAFRNHARAEGHFPRLDADDPP